MKSRKSLWIFAAAAVLLAVCVGVGLALLDHPDPGQEHPAVTGTEMTQATDPDWGRTVEDDGVLYRLNPNLSTILFLGVDDSVVAIPDTAPGEGRRADTLLLVVLDNQNRETRLVSISRDTMTEVDVYNRAGDFAYTTNTHLNMQYYYGDSPTRSCYLTKKAVSRLLYGLQIDGCLSLTIQGITDIVDHLGGIAITMPQDYTDIDPSYQAGAAVTLNGAQTERLLRYRDTGVSGSSEERARRQIQLIKALFAKLQGSVGLSKLQELLDSAGDQVCSDLDAETLKKLCTYSLSDTSYALPGQLTAGADHDEFHVDDAALRKLLIALFYQPAES